MPDVRFPGFPVAPGTLDALLKEWFGYTARNVSGEWRIREDDPALRQGPPEILKVHHRITISPDRFGPIAAEMVKAVNADYEPYLHIADATLPQEIRVQGGLGALTDVHACLLEVMISKKHEIISVIRDRLLPTLVRIFNVKYVVPISVSASKLQNYISFAKVSLLAEQFGTSKLDALIHRAGAFEGIQITPLDILSYLDSVTRAAPIPITLPVRHQGCVWHFYGDGFPVFPLLSCRGLFQEFLHELHPRFTGDFIVPLSGLKNLREENVWRWLREATAGIDRIVRYFSDIRTYIRPDGTADFLHQLRSYGSLQMLFADILALHSTVDVHVQISSTFAFLDKMANLRKYVGQVYGTEGEIYRGLASLEQGKQLKKIVRDRVGYLRPELLEVLLPLIGRAYAKVHRHLAAECELSSRKEANRLERLWFSRNLAHGTFLQGSKFETLFMQAKGTVPAEVAALPIALMWGFMCSPRNFLTYRPVWRG